MSDDTPTMPEANVSPTRVRFVYRNHRGETGTRHVIPKEIYFDKTPYCPEPQWLLRAYDLDKRDWRSFQIIGIKNWRPA